MNKPLQIGDWLINVAEFGEAKSRLRKKYRVIGETKHLYVCQNQKDTYTECFRKIDWKYGIGLRRDKRSGKTLYEMPPEMAGKYI